MDREFLFRHLEQHYISKREMFSRIPLGMQVDAIKQELLDRRRSRGTILSLSGGSGRPFWYVTTDRMVAASEKIIEALFENETEYDPYATPPPVSTLEEVFYTSFVEGSQMTMQDAMAFLQSGLSPRDIEEQLILNNRQAGSFASSNLYRQIDEEFLKDLAFTLTDGMDTGGGEFRTEDTLEIPSISGESFLLPTADKITDKVRELTLFLSDPGVHPLIKAAASHAWAFCIRPFPDGNERLGRILSNVILLRSGYTFFSDISLSALIARKGYAYYGAMDELLREENKGDMTYFMEYFMELLSRAVDERRLRKLRSHEEEMAAEIEMAKTPLSAGNSPQVSANPIQGQPAATSAPVMKEEKETNPAISSRQVEPMQEESVSNTETDNLLSAFSFMGADPSEPSFPAMQKGGDPWAFQAQRAYRLLMEYSKGSDALHEKFSSYMLDRLYKGMNMFNLQNASKAIGLEGRKLSRFIITLKKQGVLTDYKDTKKGVIYQIHAFHPDCPPFPADPKFSLLMVYAECSELNISQAAKQILSLIERGVFSFRKTELASVLKMDSKKYGATIKMLKLSGIIDSGNKEDGNTIYRILINTKRIHGYLDHSNQPSFQHESNNPISTDTNPDQKMISEENGKTDISEMGPIMYQMEDYDPEVLQTIESLKNSFSSKDKRLGEILFSNLSKGEVTLDDYIERGEESRYKIDLLLARQIGLVEKIDTHHYKILRHLNHKLPKLTKAQKRVASEIYGTFGMEKFSTEMVIANLNYSDGTVSAYLHNFTLIRILDCQKDVVNQYQFRINPKEHPEYFDITA